ncbi:MAG TPA: hypothetical protein VH369_18900 [Bryobacteraceae bacterium]
MTRTLITLAVGFGIIAAGAVQTSLRQHARATVQVKTAIISVR